MEFYLFGVNEGKMFCHIHLQTFKASGSHKKPQETILMSFINFIRILERKVKENSCVVVSDLNTL